MTSAAGGVDLAGTRIVLVLAGEVLGGAERSALELAGGLRREHGAQVEVCALDDRPGPARKLADEAGIPWTAWATPWLGSRPRKAASLARTARALRRLRPDVLLPSTNLPNVVCGLAWRVTGARVCVWNQCDVQGTTRFDQRLFRRALRASPIVVTKAEHARRWLVEELGADPGRVHVVRSTVRLPPPRATRLDWRTRLGVDETDVVVSMLAHLHAGKDHPTLLRAWRLVLDRLEPEGSKALLVLAGRPAGTHDSLKALAYDLDLRDRVCFLGETDDVGGLLAASDLAAFSSRSELFARGVTEAMSAGLAVAGTAVPGIDEALGEEGRPFLAPPGGAESLADSILRLARDPALRAAVGAANAERIRSRQGADSTTEVYAKLVSDALAGRLGPAGGGVAAPATRTA